MKIFGIGTDIVNINRIEKVLKRKGKIFKNKIFSQNEIIYCQKKKNPYPAFAKRFAAKEAFVKAMGTGIGKGVAFNNIEVKNNVNGKPLIYLNNEITKFLKKKIKSKKFSIYLSLSDDIPWAQATVIISYN